MGLGGLWGLAVGIFPDTESTTEGHATQGRGVLSVKAATLSAKQQAGTATPPCATALCLFSWGSGSLLKSKGASRLFPDLGHLG